MTVLTTFAPAKINVCLFVGPLRDDGRHELVSVMQPICFGDTVTLELGGDADAVECPGVEGDNLAAAAIAAFRDATGRPEARVQLVIDKRIPVAAGLAGGSADAGAALRLLAHAADIEDDDLLQRIAAGLGADVPAQVRPARVLATGAGEGVRALEDPPPYGVLVVPLARQLATAAVYAQADRMGLPHGAQALAARLAEVETALPDLPDELAINDLEPAALSLCPAIGAALGEVRAAGADHVLVSGSGPTVLGLFRDAGAAYMAADELERAGTHAIATVPAGARDARVL